MDGVRHLGYTRSKTARGRKRRKNEAYLLPRGDLLVGPDAGDVHVSACGFVCDKSRLADDQCARNARARGIVFDGKISVRVLVVCPDSGQRCHDHSVLEGDRADLYGLEKLGCGHCNASVCQEFAGTCCSPMETSFIRQFIELGDYSCLTGMEKD